MERPGTHPLVPKLDKDTNNKPSAIFTKIDEKSPININRSDLAL